MKYEEKSMKERQKQKNNQQGQAIITAVVFFMLISLVMIVGIMTPLLRHLRASHEFIRSRQSYYTAEALNEDGIYRLNKSLPTPPSWGLSLNGASATATLTTTVFGKQIYTLGNFDLLSRAITTVVSQGVGAAFNYGVQAGQGGFVLNNGSQVNGNVYANGNIYAVTGVVITGSAIAANSPTLTTDQSNNTPITPPNSITFGNTAPTSDFAQSFQVSTSSPINKIDLYIKKANTPNNSSVKIVTDSNGQPSSTDLLTTDGALNASQVGTSYSWVTVTFPSNPVLNSGTTYWLVIDTNCNIGNYFTCNSNNYYVLGANNGVYINGAANLGRYGNSWSAISGQSTIDGYFNLYLGGLTSIITGNSYQGGVYGVYVGQNGVGDAWAHTIEGTNVAGNLYCQSASYVNKVCNTSRGDPPIQAMPFSDADIADLKAQAIAGGVINGDYHVGYQNATTGPIEIKGNLLIDGGGLLTLTGTVYVTGNITVSNGGKIALASSYGSGDGMLVSDGYVNLSGGGTLSGSGQSGSSLFLFTTSACPNGPSCNGNNAITVNGGAGAVALVAQNGTISLSGGAKIKEATAYQITASGGTTITYDTGLANANFVSGPGGAWNVKSWEESAQ